MPRERLYKAAYFGYLEKKSDRRRKSDAWKKRRYKNLPEAKLLN